MRDFSTGTTQRPYRSPGKTGQTEGASIVGEVGVVPLSRRYMSGPDRVIERRYGNGYDRDREQEGKGWSREERESAEKVLRERLGDRCHERKRNLKGSLRVVSLSDKERVTEPPHK